MLQAEIIAERLSARQLNSSRFRNAINMRLQRYAVQQLLRTPHTRQVSACMQRACTYGHQVRTATIGLIRRLASLRKGSSERKTVVIQKSSTLGDAESSSTYLLATTLISIQIRVGVYHVLRVLQCNDLYQYLLL